jgi:O-antigen ligase
MLGISLNLWRLTLLSVLILPLIPSLGEIGLVIVLVTVSWQRKQAILNYPLNWGIALVALGLIISACFAANVQEALLGLANFLPFLAIVAVFGQLFTDFKRLRQLAWVLILPSLPIVLLGWGQLYGGWSLPNLLGWELVAQGNPTGRMASVFIYANFLAIYLLLVFCFTLGLWLENYRQFHQKKALICLSVYLLVQISGLILTSSRNAWAIALVGGLVFAFYLGWRWLVWFVLGMLSVTLWASYGPEPGRKFWRNYIPRYIWGRLSDEMYSDRPIATLRKTQWQFSWELVQQRPWWGWGLRNFTILYKDQMDVWLGHPHNLYLMLMAETGIPVTVSIMLLVGWILTQAVLILPHLREEKIIFLTYLIAFSACIIFNCFDVSLFDLRVNTLSWFILAAIAGTVLNFNNKSYVLNNHQTQL